MRITDLYFSWWLRPGKPRSLTVGGVNRLVLGVGFAALRESSDLWESGIFTLMLGVLLISILLAIHRTEKRRAFWIGFVLLGSTYLGLSLVPSIESRLMTTKALAYLVDSRVSGRSILFLNTVMNRGTGSVTGNNRVFSVTFNPDGSQIAASSPGQVWVYDRTTGKPLGALSGTTEYFVRIGHSLLALIAAILGGLLSRHLHARNLERRSEPPEPAESLSGQRSML